MQLDIAEDFFLLDNLETAILKIQGQPDLTIPSVLTEPYTIRELDPTGGQVLRQGTVFVWPKVFAPAPPIGSVLVDTDGTYWTVYRIVTKGQVNTIEPFCLNLSIVTAPANTATLLKATYAHGRAGEARAIWKGFFSGQKVPTAEDTVPARFQPVDETARIEFGAEWSRQSYRVYLESPLPIQDVAGGQYHVLDSAGHHFRAVRYYDQERIDRLPVILVNKIVEGPEYFSNPSPGP
jgi:hypothetical protein